MVVKIDSRNKVAGVLFYDTRRSAARRKHFFNLTREDVFKLSQGNCHYCGVAPSVYRAKNNDSLLKNGIDRKDSAKGYTIENCVPCCEDCNKSKGTREYGEFVESLPQVLQARANYSAKVAHHVAFHNISL